ncbi:MAG: hypothetical protein AABP62_25275 [Planctomycetota bacterium]
MRFPYQHYEIPASPVDGSTDLYRPEIPLHLIGESDELFLFGLLDTGADGVVIGRGIAATIGAALDETVRWTLRGLNSRPLEAVLGRIDIEVMDGRESATWRMPVAVVTFDDPQHEDIVLLGQTGFLQFFDMRFLGSQHAVELVPNASFPGA